ncbi:MAG: fibronectin type III domain-containing protein [Melioribacteraceae bacterium]|nr:fibronectin type III domain-containing protein [Melioribacteraceae bacterium]
MKLKYFLMALFIVSLTQMNIAQITTPAASVPANLASGVSIVPTFTWGGGSSHTIQVATDNAFANIVYTSGGDVASGHQIPIANQLLNGVTYYWRAINNGGAGYNEFSTLAPAVPYLSSPTNFSVVSDQFITFAWSSSVAGIEYTLEVATDAGVTVLVGAATTVTTSTSVTLNTSIFTTGTDYWWRVTAKTLGGAIINYSNIWKFSIAGLPQPIASYPSGGVNIYNNPPSLYWYQLGYNSKVTSYEVRYRRSDVGVYGALLGTFDATEGYFNSASTNWFTTIPFALTQGATYYWQVRSHDGTTGSAWSLEQNFVVFGTYTFLVCYPSYPVLGAAVDALPTFYWYSNTYAPVLFFELEIDDDPLFGSVNLTVSNIPALSYTLTSGNITTLNPTLGGTYYWRVKGRLTAGGLYGPVSTSGSFVYPSTVNAAASAPVPTISGPTSGSVVFVTNPTLTWSASYSEPLQFKVIYSTSPSTTAGILDFPIVSIASSPWLNTSSFVLTGLTPGATYYWQVQSRIISSGTTSAWSTLGYFTLSPGAASVVPLAGSPINGYPINNTSATISWIIPAPSTSKLTYDLEYSTDKNFTTSQKLTGLTGTSVTLQGLEKNKDYFWRVASKTEKGEISSFSAPTAFSTGSVVSVEETVIPNTFELMQNYPNPFNPSTQIKFTTPVNGFVTLKIYDLLGKEIKTLINSEYSAGSHSIQWNGDDNMGNKVSTGIYVYRMTTGNFASSKKMLLIK